MPWLADYDWVYGPRGEVLHGPARDTSQEDYEELEDAGHPMNFKLACGRRLTYASIPGIFSRMGAWRCRQCCDALGYPQGIGSPKNNDICRKLLGMEPMEVVETETEAPLEIPL